MAQAIAQKNAIVQYGPYGNKAAANFSFKLQGCEQIKEVIVRHGFIIDAIGFVIAGPCGGSQTEMFGGNGGNESKIVLKCGEYITQISGTTGDYSYMSNNRLVSTLKIHTNLCPNGYGPFGTGQCTKNVCNFSSPMPLDGSIIGFLGNAQGYLLSLGIYAEKLLQGC